jgi:hypothetical protein
MLSLQSHRITDLYCAVDDMLLKTANAKGGRPSVLCNSEVITILAWNTLVVKQKTIKDIYQWVTRYHQQEFPKMPNYQSFVAHCHRVIPDIGYVLESLLKTTAYVRIMDSTMIPVCKKYRADSHKVAKDVAKFGKNHQGWHYGFKLHASIDLHGRLCAVALTPANQYDAQMMTHILNENTKVAVGDGGYTARVMREIIWKMYGTMVIAPPHVKQKHKIASEWQMNMLQTRPKIESVFDFLKEHLHLVTSFARSVKGYLFHYLRILLGYQLMVV